MNDPVHRSMKLFLCFYPPIVHPPIATLLPLTIRWLGTPRHVPPQNRFVKARRLEHGSGIDAVIEEHNQCRSPVVPDRVGLFPAAQSWKFVSGEVQGIEIRLGQIVTPSNISLFLRFRKSRELGYVVMLPSP